MNKKNIILVSLLVTALFISGISNLLLILNYPQPSHDFSLPREQTLIVGISQGPYSLEIVDSMDWSFFDAFYQVVETLFAHDLRNPELPRINLLAESYHWENKTIVHIKLHEGILFHDGTLFNATAAKWNLDRLLYLTNCTGTNHGEVAWTQYDVWRRSDRRTPIIKSVSINGEYNITITLTDPYGPLLNLLTHLNAAMLSPTAHKNDTTRFIELTTDKLVGTGPFVYVRYIPGVEVVLSRWEAYWEHVAYFGYLQFKIFDDAEEIDTAMLNGQIDIPQMTSRDSLPTFEADENVVVKHYTDETGIPYLGYIYIAFNNDRLNVTWRKTLSYAINYTHIIEELKENRVVRANSPISPGFGLFHNNTVRAADYNITKAREIMVSMGHGDMSWTDAQWIAVAESTNPFLRVNYTYYFLNQKDIGLSLSETIRYIGVSVDMYDTMWEFFGPYCPDCFGREDGCMTVTSWGPDYLDPYSILDPLTRMSYYYPQINDTTLNAMIELALETTDDTERTKIYKNIQWYYTKIGFFNAPLYHIKIYYVHSADLRNIAYNSRRIFQAYGIWRVAPPIE